jgi:hypothetical protein
VEQEDFTRAMEQFNRRVGSFAANLTPADKALNQLGLTMADLRNKTPDEQLRIVADRISKIEDPALKAAIASDLFGRSGVKLLGVLNEGRGGLAKYAAEAQRFGLILSQDVIDRAAAAEDEFDRIGAAAKVAAVNLAAGFLPAIESVRRSMTSAEFQAGVRNLAAGMAEFIDVLVRNQDKVVIAAAAFAGLRLGAAVGAPFGAPTHGLLALGGADDATAAGRALRLAAAAAAGDDDRDDHDDHREGQEAAEDRETPLALRGRGGRALALQALRPGGVAPLALGGGALVGHGGKRASRPGIGARGRRLDGDRPQTCCGEDAPGCARRIRPGVGAVGHARPARRR